MLLIRMSDRAAFGSCVVGGVSLYPSVAEGLARAQIDSLTP